MKVLKFIISAVFLLAVAFSSYAQTADLPYEQEGMIYAINQETGVININDINYSVALDVEVNTGNDVVLGVDNLKPNTSIGYILEGKVIRQVWLLDRAPIDHSINDD